MAQNIYQRMLAIMAELEYVQKGERTQSGPSYSYVKHDDVAAVIHPLCVKHGVYVKPSVRSSSVETAVTKNKRGEEQITNVCSVDLELTFVNVDEPSECFSCNFPGLGVDNGDKAAGKAVSYAMKTALLKAYMLATGEEDNEARNGATPIGQPRNGNGGKPAPDPQWLAQLIEDAGRVKGPDELRQVIDQASRMKSEMTPAQLQRAQKALNDASKRLKSRAA